MVRRMFPSSVAHHHQRDRRVGIRMRFGSIIPTKRNDVYQVKFIVSSLNPSPLSLSLAAS